MSMMGRKCRAVLALLALLLTASLLPAADAAAAGVQLDSSAASPRTLEVQTQQAIIRDYRFAWTSLAQALEFNTADPLEGPFVENAKKTLSDKIASQRRNGLSERYLDQNHKLRAVFYAPEGDVIELHDTADYQLQILDGNKIIHDEHVTRHYVVLMTPAADRWVIRQLQAVAEF
jgi:hypothetical protein